jgi:membrane dipeptidase
MDPTLARAEAVLKAAPLIDGHNDLPWRIREDTIARKDVDKYDLRTKAPGMTDIPRLRAGHLGAQFWSVYIPGDSGAYGYAKMQAEQIKIAKAIVAKYPDVFEWTLTAADISRAFAAGKIGSLMGVEGGHAIENSLDTLRSYYRQGARYMTLTHNVTLDWADAALDTAKHGGLTKFGEEVVREMNRLGMLVDLSHVSPGTMSDALNVTEAPVIFSHSSARALVDHQRNVPDSILRRLNKNGGVVMVSFVPNFTSKASFEHANAQTAAFAEIAKRPGFDSAAKARADSDWVKANPAPKVLLTDVADHIDYIKKVAGADHVGIGSDFDGIEETVVGLDNVSTYPALFAELARRGWTDDDLKKLAGGNLLRVLASAEQTAARLQKARPASRATIEQLDGRRPTKPGKDQP